MVRVEVEVTSDTSVRVSWDSLDVPEITGYIVYYQSGVINELSVNVSLTTAQPTINITVEGLMNNEEYQFQVVAVAELDGEVIIGQRSVVVTMVVALPTTNKIGTDGIIFGVIIILRKLMITFFINIQIMVILLQL